MPDSEPTFLSPHAAAYLSRHIYHPNHDFLQEMETPSSKNLRGLFNLIRKESSTLRQEIQTLEISLASLSGFVSGLAVEGDKWKCGGKDEILESLRRIENLLKSKVEDGRVEGGGGKLGEQEAGLLRSLLQAPERKEVPNASLQAEDDVQVESSLDTHNTPTPESSDAGTTSKERRIAHEPERHEQVDNIHADIGAAEVPAQAQNLPLEASQSNPDSSNPNNALIDRRLDTMASQIESLMQGQKETFALLKDLVGRSAKDQKGPVVVPPPRKVGRKVVGFVYEDDDGEGGRVPIEL